MEVKLNKQFMQRLDEFTRVLRQWRTETRKDLRSALRRIGQRHRAEAVKRVPVDEASLKQRIVTNQFEEGGTLFEETGTNVKGYPSLVEFGTSRIAGGRVLALGDGIEVTDAQAIKDWPAKTGGLTGLKTDSQGRIRDSSGRFLANGGREQMPWLRPAFNAIREWAVEQLEDAMKPPKA